MALRRCTLLVAILCLAGSPAGAGSRLDLTEFIAPLPEVGDYKVFAETGGGWVREEIVAIEPVDGGWRVEKHYSHAQGPLAVVHQVVMPGVRAGAESTSSGLGTLPASMAAFASRARRRELSLPAKRAVRSSEKWNEFTYLSERRFRSKRRVRLGSIAPLDTPYASHPDAALVKVRVRVGSRWRSVLMGFDQYYWRRSPWVDRSDVASWYVEGIGLVGESGRHRVTKRGRVREQTSYEIWLREGVIRGVSYPTP